MFQLHTTSEPHVFYIALSDRSTETSGLLSTVLKPSATYMGLACVLGRALITYTVLYPMCVKLATLDKDSDLFIKLSRLYNSLQAARVCRLSKLVDCSRLECLHLLHKLMSRLFVTAEIYV